MPTEIQIPSILLTVLRYILAVGGAFFVALWISLIIWTFRDARQRSRDVFAILLATLMVTIFGPFGLILYFLLRPPTTLAELYERSLEEEALLQDLEERPHCPGCSRQVDEAWIVCPDCHTSLKKNCVQCGKGLDLTWNICPFCATPAQETPLAMDSHRQPLKRPQPTYQPEPVYASDPVVAGPVSPRPGAQANTETRPMQPRLNPAGPDEAAPEPPPLTENEAPTRPYTIPKAGELLNRIYQSLLPHLGRPSGKN
jgi:hypothetical protein